MFETIISGGTLYDGMGGDGFVADIAISDGRIAAIGDLSDAQAVVNESAVGLCVSPGFIDLHTHSDYALLVDGRAQSQVHQGVTTEVTGQCGFSCAPARCDHDIEMWGSGFFESDIDLGWRSFGDYLDRLEQVDLGVNVAACVGHGAIHRAVLGDELRTPNDEEVSQMALFADQAMEQGAAGFTTGLEYWPGSLCGIEHIAPICQMASKYNRLYATHVRNRDIYYDLGFGEAIATARAAGARLQISHIQTKFGAPPHAIEHALEMVTLARRRGLDVAFDVIPHDWSHTQVVAILPKWAQQGGVQEILVRLRDTAARETLKRNANPMWRLVPAGKWQEIRILHSNANPHLIGATLEEIGRDRNIDPYDAVFDLLLEEGEELHQLLWTSRSFSDDDIRLCLEQPECAVISDTIALAPDGILSNMIGSISGYGWVARFLAKYVREEAILSMGDAIRRVTSLPAERIALKNRGCLRQGYLADICVFDSTKIASNCNIQNPTAFADGFAHVLVNGNFALRNGQRTTSNTGTVIREFRSS